MKALWILIVSAALSPAGDAPKGDKGDREKLQGTWKVVSLVNDGQEVPPEKIEEARLTFEGDRYSLKGGEEGYRGTFKLDSGQSPRQITTTFLADDGKEKGKALGIYELDGKRLRICWRHEGEERPKQFASRPGSGIRLMVLERE
jgi:uncharacterized protein (TIGR03067 family)